MWVVLRVKKINSMNSKRQAKKQKTKKPKAHKHKTTKFPVVGALITGSDTQDHRSSIHF